ncbi:MAG: glucosaminidase domain-containing protein [Rikenellaceae bacterium]|nr:glucosaminidase domain-containing protein [Rikenellaceae bacterium]
MTIEAALAQSRPTRQTREEYIERYKHIAIDQMERYGIPASITMAQGILESDCGNSTLSRSSNNHFGIKCKRDWTGEKVYHDDDEKGECFRAYPTVEDSYDDHAEFLDRQPRYDSLFVYASDDYHSWARGLKACGYATAPDYAERLVRIIEDAKLYLLDKPNGDNLYAQHRNEQKDPDAWFASQSSTNDHQASTGIDPDNYRVTINAHQGYNIYEQNEVYYILSKENDTFENIASKFMISARNLRKFNDLKEKDAQPMTDEVVYIERKKSRWKGRKEYHLCREGETPYAIGQRYGIRTRSIEKMNRLKGHEELAEGRKIRIK